VLFYREIITLGAKNVESGLPNGQKKWQKNRFLPLFTGKMPILLPKWWQIPKLRFITLPLFIQTHN